MRTRYSSGSSLDAVSPVGESREPVMPLAARSRTSCHWVRQLLSTVVTADEAALTVAINSHITADGENQVLDILDCAKTANLRRHAVREAMRQGKAHLVVAFALENFSDSESLRYPWHPLILEALVGSDLTDFLALLVRGLPKLCTKLFEACLTAGKMDLFCAVVSASAQVWKEWGRGNPLAPDLLRCTPEPMTDAWWTMLMTIDTDRSVELAKALFGDRIVAAPQPWIIEDSGGETDHYAVLAPCAKDYQNLVRQSSASLEHLVFSNLAVAFVDANWHSHNGAVRTNQVMIVPRYVAARNTVLLPSKRGFDLAQCENFGGASPWSAGKPRVPVSAAAAPCRPAALAAQLQHAPSGEPATIAAPASDPSATAEQSALALLRHAPCDEATARRLLYLAQSAAMRSFVAKMLTLHRPPLLAELAVCFPEMLEPAWQWRQIAVHQLRYSDASTAFVGLKRIASSDVLAHRPIIEACLCKTHGENSLVRGVQLLLTLVGTCCVPKFLLKESERLIIERQISRAPDQFLPELVTEWAPHATLQAASEAYGSPFGDWHTM